MKPVYLAGAVRTPIGRFGGSLQSWTAADLGTAVAKETLRRAGVQPDGGRLELQDPSGNVIRLETE